MLERQDLENIKNIVQDSIRNTVPGIVQGIVQDTVPGIVQNSLAPLEREVFYIKEKIEKIEIKIDMIIRAESEDVTAVNSDVIKLKERVANMEKQIQLLQNQNSIV